MRLPFKKRKEFSNSFSSSIFMETSNVLFSPRFTSFFTFTPMKAWPPLLVYKFESLIGFWQKIYLSIFYSKLTGYGHLKGSINKIFVILVFLVLKVKLKTFTPFSITFFVKYALQDIKKKDVILLPLFSQVQVYMKFVTLPLFFYIFK